MVFSAFVVSLYEDMKLISGEFTPVLFHLFRSIKKLLYTQKIKGLNRNLSKLKFG